jgi:radical SAM superfamily enzyme YgiQ (UPF0313 family)
VQSRFKDKPSVLLFFPPGWSLNYGAPHIGLPIIKGYLSKYNISCDIQDLNIESSRFFGVTLSEQKLLSLMTDFDSENAYKFYFSFSDKLQKIAEKYKGQWRIKSGFVYDGCDLSSSKDIEYFSKIESPFTKFYEDNIISKISNHSYSIIGISVTVPSQLLSAFEISRIIRKSGYKGIIVLGGNTITRLKEELFLDWIYDVVDCIVLNQGEESLKLIFDSLQNNGKFDNIPNLLWRKNGKIIYNGYKHIEKSQFSMPNFEGYPIGEYWGINYLPIIGARGCYYGKCNFCSIPYAWGNDGFVGLDNPTHVFNSINESIQKYNIHNFSFVEETMHPKTIKEIAKLVAESNININFEGYIRFESIWLNDSLLSLLSNSGLKKVFIGMELISNKNRNNLNKNDNANQIVEFLKKFKKYGIKVHLFTMFGFPGTNELDAIDTVKFLFDNSDLIDTIDVSHFVYSKHTQINGVTPLIETSKDWAIEYDFIAENSSYINSKEAQILANGLESIVIQTKPQWTHPIYRMYTAWQ